MFMTFALGNPRYDLCSETEMTNLELKSWPKKLLGISPISFCTLRFRDGRAPAFEKF
jgi:hypothetical protein